MKRLLILLTLLLMMALPALAETPPEETVAALHPGLAVTDHIMAGEDAFFLLKSPEDVRSCCTPRLSSAPLTAATATTATATTACPSPGTARPSPCATNAFPALRGSTTSPAMRPGNGASSACVRTGPAIPICWMN